MTIFHFFFFFYSPSWTHVFFSFCSLDTGLIKYSYSKILWFLYYTFAFFADSIYIVSKSWLYILINYNMVNY